MVRVTFNYREHEAKVVNLPRNTTAASLYLVIKRNDHLTGDFVARQIYYGLVRLKSDDEVWTLGSTGESNVQIVVLEFLIREPDDLLDWIMSSQLTQSIRKLGQYHPFVTFRLRMASDEFTTSMREYPKAEQDQLADSLGVRLQLPAGDVKFVAPDGFYSMAEMQHLSAACGFTVDQLIELIKLTNVAEGTYQYDLVQIILGEQEQSEMQTRSGIQVFQRYHGTYEEFGPYALTTQLASKQRVMIK